MYDAQQTANLQACLNFKKNSGMPFSAENIAAIKEAIQNGADPSTTDDGLFKNTALLWALIDKEVDLANFLIEHDKQGLSFDICSQCAFVSHNTPLILAIKKNLYDIAFMLIEKHADLSATKTCSDQLSPLHFAILLLGRKDDIKIEYSPNLFGSSPTLTQDTAKQKELIHKLIEHGANLKAKDKFGKTPLDYLSQSLYKEDLFNCIEVIPINRFLGNKGMSKKDIEEKAILLSTFIQQCNVIKREAVKVSPAKAIEIANTQINRLKETLDPNIIEYLALENAVRQNSRTAKEIMDDPNNHFMSVQQIQQSKLYDVFFSGKGGDKTISLVMKKQLDDHKLDTDFFESRNSYLQSDDYHQFCGELKKSLDKQPGIETP